MAMSLKAIRIVYACELIECAVQQIYVFIICADNNVEGRDAMIWTTTKDFNRIIEKLAAKLFAKTTNVDGS